jgi:hypothetical protein
MFGFIGELSEASIAFYHAARFCHAGSGTVQILLALLEVIGTSESVMFF